jgi:hypothetical protein
MQRKSVARTRGLVLGVVVWLAATLSSASSPPNRFVPVDAGPATSGVNTSTLVIGNRAIQATWSVASGHLKPESFEDRGSNHRVPVGDEAFVLTLANGRVIKASEMTIAGAARDEALPASPLASRLSARVPGRQIVVTLRAPDASFQATWRAIVRDGSNYVRQELTIAPQGVDLSLNEIALLDVRLPGAHVAGIVDGSPIVTATVFAGIEHPLSVCRVEGDRARCTMKREVPIKVGQSVTIAAVEGVAPPDQFRRGFLQYVERERAHPYRTFLHYNSWYDTLGSPLDETSTVEAIDRYGRELVQKRGVTIDSFLFDDGWDDPNTLWRFNAGFPRGFAPLQTAATRYGTAPGVWLSPFGGYGEHHKQRLTAGMKAGWETNALGFALSGPVYYQRFRDICLEFVKTYGVNQFKFDGLGPTTGPVPGSQFGSDFEAAIQLIDDLRVARPDLFVNLTTGTWPSPFWLQYADATWRSGSDNNFTGVGSDRQRWITFRDARTYTGIVKKGPLYPLNALMLGGLIYARKAKWLDTDPNGDFVAEVRSFFGSGTQLQELYITPSILTDANWDTLAQAARWSRQNADVLVDTHWVGGDPAGLDVYGWASWTPAKAILVLRNPSDKPATFAVDVQHVFEIPAGHPLAYRAHSPWKEDERKPGIDLQAGQPHVFELQPFEVLTLDVAPRDMTEFEYRTRMTQWALLAGPLPSDDPRSGVTPAMRQMLTNAWVINLNKDELKRPAHRIRKDGDLEVWVRPLAGGALAVGLFNTGTASARITVRCDEVQACAGYKVMDLWLKDKDQRTLGPSLSMMVPGHGAELMRLDPKK